MNSIDSFIKGHDFVFSVETDVNLGANYDILHEGSLSLKHKLPLKMYIGLKRGNLLFGNIYSANEIKKPLGQSIENLGEVESYVISNYSNIEGKQINIFSEFPRGIGLGFVGCFSALVAAAILQINKSITSEGLALLRSKKCHKELSDNPELSVLFNLSNQLEELIRDAKLSGSNTFSKLIWSNEPIIYKDNNGGRISTFFESYFDITQVVDYLVLYPGKKGSSSYVFSCHKDSIKKQENQLSVGINDFLGRQLYESLKDLYGKPYSDIRLERFLGVLTKYRYAAHLLENTNISSERIKNELIHLLHKDHPNISFGVKFLNNSSLAGSIFVALSKNISSKELNDFISELAELSNERPTLIYASSETGFGNEGLNLIKSSVEKRLEPEPKFLIDRIEKRFYVNGKKIRSDKLPSQYQAIQLLEKLLAMNETELINSDLEKSAYSSNKYNMLSKVISPLVKLVQDELNEKLDISCRGSQTQFYLKLRKPKFKITFR